MTNNKKVSKKPVKEAKKELSSEIEKILEQKDLRENLKPKEPQLSFGQQLVGITFNPSNDPKVQRSKEICAELADMVFELGDKPEGIPIMYWILLNPTLSKILDAQMSAVKLITLK